LEARFTVPDSPGPWVWLARIRRPQGRKGEVLAGVLTDFPERFGQRKQLWLLPPEVSSAAGAKETLAAPPPAARAVELTSHWLHKGAIVLHFAGVDSISAAEELKEWIVAIPRAERAPLDEDETYISDLVGCTVVDLAGPEPTDVGPIEEVDRSGGAAPLLVVRGARGEVLIPFAKAYLRKIDLQAHRVEMALPVGMVNLDEAES
jgi:16S rRNA processing protein RimM